VAGGASIAGLLLVAGLAWLGGTATAQAAGPQQHSGSVYRNLAAVVVRPGQTLWEIALRAQPSADPRAVVQEIVDLNALPGSAIEPGERLWVPKG
jgi:LysM domain-containing protein